MQGWPPRSDHIDLKKRGRYEQDITNDEYHLKTGLGSKNDSDLWTPSRCSFPDYPITTQVGLSHYDLKKKGGLRQQRKKRFALFGGRWEKTELTYK